MNFQYREFKLNSSFGIKYHYILCKFFIMAAVMKVGIKNLNFSFYIQGVPKKSDFGTFLMTSQHQVKPLSSASLHTKVLKAVPLFWVTLYTWSFSLCSPITRTVPPSTEKKHMKTLPIALKSVARITNSALHNVLENQD